MSRSAAPTSRRPWLEWGATLAVGLVALLGYRASPVFSVLDSRYSLLTSEVLLHERTWDLTKHLPSYAQSAAEWGVPRGAEERKWQVRSSHGRLLYVYPPGTSLLSVPAVAVMNGLGWSTMSARGRYSREGERQMQEWLAQVLSAVSALLCMRLARRELPLPHAVAVGLVSAFGTFLWSTASRSLWMHTWGTLLVCAAMLELLRWEDGGRRRPELLGFLLVAAFWVRPTNAVFAAAMTLYVLWRHRAATVRLVATGAIGALGYLAYSQLVWGAPVQGYMKGVRRLGRDNAPSAALSMLFDPTRGLLVFCPFLVIAVLVVARFGVARQRRPFALLAFALVAATFAVYAGFRYWWGPGTVGSRYLTELTPVLVWFAAHAWRRQREAASRGGPLWRIGIATAALVAVVASFLAHSTGAFDYSLPAAKRSMASPRSARVDPAGGPDRLPWFAVLPQRLPLAYWGLLPEPRTRAPLSAPPPAH